MEDDKIRDLFAGFQPVDTDNGQFMESLKRSIDAVEMVKAQHKSMRRHNRLGVAIAAVAGFITGAVSMTFIPTLEAMFATGISLSVPMMSKPVMLMPELVSTSIVGALVVAAAISVYYLVETLPLAAAKKRG